MAIFSQVGVASLEETQEVDARFSQAVARLLPTIEEKTQVVIRLQGALHWSPNASDWSETLSKTIRCPFHHSTILAKISHGLAAHSGPRLLRYASSIDYYREKIPF